MWACSVCTFRYALCSGLPFECSTCIWADRSKKTGGSHGFLRLWQKCIEQVGLRNAVPNEGYKSDSCTIYPFRFKFFDDITSKNLCWQIDLYLFYETWSAPKSMTLQDCKDFSLLANLQKFPTHFDLKIFWSQICICIELMFWYTRLYSTIIEYSYEPAVPFWFIISTDESL